jgi:hypothetical protein
MVADLVIAAAALHQAQDLDFTIGDQPACRWLSAWYGSGVGNIGQAHGRHLKMRKQQFQEVGVARGRVQHRDRAAGRRVPPWIGSVLQRPAHS